MKVTDHGSEVANLRELIDSLPALIHTGRPDGYLDFFNQRWLQFVGLRPEELEGWKWTSAVHRDDVTGLVASWRACIASGEPLAYEARVRRSDGEYRWILHQKVAVRDETGQIVKWYGTSTEIEDRKQVEQKLRQVLEEVRGSEANLRRTIDTIPALVSSFLPDGSNECMSQRWHDYTGLSPEQSEGDGWQEPVHPDDLAPLMDRWREALVSGEPGEIEARLRRHDGVFRWFFVRAEPLRDATGNVVKWYATSTDIEDRKQAEEGRRRNESFLLEAQELSHTGSWRHDALSRTVTVTPEVRRIFGVKPEENPLTAEFFFKKIHPDDLPGEERKYAKALSAKADFESDYRIVLPDGGIKHVHNTGHPVLNDRGAIVEFVGTVVDVTEQWQARANLEKALEEIRRLRDKLHGENLALREEIDRASMFEEIVGSSDAIRQVLGQVTKVAPTDSTVLISGETGTGKELIARAIHKRSNRAARAFIRVNCGAIAPSLIASELFGHEKGAFTGAFQRRIGHFEAADGGTILLDEIGDLPMEMQSTLLRVLQEEEFQRVGSSQYVKVDVRVLAATNRDLRSAVATGKFREDLFYRLNVFPIRLPALRERREDIPLLVEYLVTRYAQKAGRKYRDITSKTLQLFQAYRWPGNIRELQNVIERAVVLCDGDTFSVEERWLESSVQSVPAVPMVTTLEDRERQMIEEALAQSRGRISGSTGAAAKLGIPRQTLDRKIVSLGIDKNQFKTAR